MVKNHGYLQLGEFEETSKKAKQEFSNIFKETDFLRGGEPYYKHIIDLLKLKDNSKLIDIGFGRGFFLRSIEKHKVNLYGIDFSEEAKKQAESVLKEAKLFVGDAHKIPFKDDYFDYVTCLGVIEHLVNPEIGINEIKRILKEDGTVIFTIPNSIYASINLKKQLIKYNTAKILNIMKLRKKKAVHMRQPIDRFYTPKEAIRLLEKNGLNVEKIELIKSKRENFKIIYKNNNKKVRLNQGLFTANFTLLVCKKSIKKD